MSCFLGSGYLVTTLTTAMHILGGLPPRILESRRLCTRHCQISLSFNLSPEVEAFYANFSMHHKGTKLYFVPVRLAPMYNPDTDPFHRPTHAPVTGLSRSRYPSPGPNDPLTRFKTPTVIKIKRPRTHDNPSGWTNITRSGF
jgi:hypothetical protein